MKDVVLCPRCKNLVYFNSYFGAYICQHCDWEDASYAKQRNSGSRIRAYRITGTAAAATKVRNNLVTAKAGQPAPQKTVG